MTRPQIHEVAPLHPYHRPARAPVTADDIIERLSAELSRARRESVEAALARDVAIGARDEERERGEDLRELAQQLLGYVGRFAEAGDPEAEELVELAGEVGLMVEVEGSGA